MKSGVSSLIGNQVQVLNSPAAVSVFYLAAYDPLILLYGGIGKVQSEEAQVRRPAVYTKKCLQLHSWVRHCGVPRPPKGADKVHGILLCSIRAQAFGTPLGRKHC